MLSADRKKSLLIKEERGNGFSLVVVLLGILILTALGFLSLSVTTGDLQISHRIVGEKKALNAAEAGIHVLIKNFSPTITAEEITGYADAADQTSKYTIRASTPPADSTAPSFLPMKGYSIAGGQEWGQKMYETSVTGENTNYGSSVQVDVGFGYFDGGGIMYR